MLFILLTIVKSCVVMLTTFPNSALLFPLVLVLQSPTTVKGVIRSGGTIQTATGKVGTYSPDCALASTVWNAMGGTAGKINSSYCCNDIDISCSPTSPFSIIKIAWTSLSLPGPIPSQIGQFSALQTLDLNSNALTGSVPSNLGNLTNLQSLSLYGNTLSGSLPSALGNLKKLQYINLSNNQLSGALPSTLGNWTQVQYLDLSNNKFSGSLPTGWATTVNPKTVYIVGNSLSYAYPTQMAKDCAVVSSSWTQMGGLGTINSTFCCNTNTVFCSFTRVTQIFWGLSSLTGSIPAQLGQLTGLQRLSLMYNSLTGAIPSSLGNLTNLIGLDLSFNQLSGTIPSALGNMTSLQGLILSSNQMTGSIPSNLGNLKNLNALWIQNNQFSGPIPSALGLWTNLTDITLNDNQFSGPIPSTLGNLKNLQSLYLSGNQLNGNIPTTFGNLTNLKYLYLYNNQLTGVPSSLNLSRIPYTQIFPNPMSSAPYDIVANAPSLFLTNVTWLPFLNTPVTMKKRQTTSSSGSVTLQTLLQMCNLSNIQSSLVPAGCIAGVYKTYCLYPSNATLVKQCQNAYDQAIGASIFNSLGAVCPAWKQGPFSKSCASAVTSFSYMYPVDSTRYIQLNSTHAGQFVTTILASQTYAPCVAPAPACNWTNTQ